jgi:hypothetical protein
MCWLQLWVGLRDQGFSEAVIASCFFGSIHKKECRLLCTGGHIHVRVEGSPTKPSAIYVDVDGLAWHIGLAFHKSLDSLDAQE